MSVKTAPVEPEAKPKRDAERTRRRRPDPAPNDEPIGGGVVSLADYNQMRRERDEAQQQLKADGDTIDQLNGRIAELEPLSAKVAELEGSLRSASAERLYDKVAGELNVPAEFREAVWKLSGFQVPDAGTDEQALRDHVSKYLEKNPQYAKVAPGKPSKLPKDQFAGKGGDAPADGDGGKVQVSRKDYGRLEWREANEKLIADTSLFELVD